MELTKTGGNTPADLVNPYIGSISHLLTTTIPEVFVPYSYIRAFPLGEGCVDRYCNEEVLGFPLGAASIMPGRGVDFENTLDHSREWCRCFKNELILEKYGIGVEMTAARHCHLYRFTGAGAVKVSVPPGGTIGVENGVIRIHAPLKDRDQKLPGQFIILSSDKPFKVLSSSGTDLVIDAPAGGAEYYAAVSFISFAKAAESLSREISPGYFDAAVDELKTIWNNYLGRFKIEGNTTDRRIVFYTAVYRVFRRMIDNAEYGEYFSGFDLKIHRGDHFFTRDQLWDTFRTPHPLRMLVDRENEELMLQSYLDMYGQSGYLPSFISQFNEIGPMIGFHAAALFADARSRGLKADYAKAYEGMRKNAMEQCMLPWNCRTPLTVLDTCYLEKGFFPALKKGEKETIPNVNEFERRQAVSVTLEHSFDDWCVAQLAKTLGKEDDYNYFMKRSHNWKNLYREDLGLFAPKDLAGNWVEDFDPMYSGGQGGRDYFTENNGYTWQWGILHDPMGLFEKMGGKAEAEKKLDTLFRMGTGGSNNKYVYMGQFPDSTGLMGQFCMGNEPSFHIPYLYDYLGTPWKAQKRLRDLMDIWYFNSPLGICGDEDEGTLSGWLVFSALGFFPVCPGSGRYAIGTPLFDRASISLGDGKAFTITSPGAGEGRRYIQSARLNGKPLAEPFLSHEELSSGAELVLEMGNAPRMEWNGGA
ncbi:MAG: GH92 family glycosyl hydrolase [Treponema sp.]|jgi:predicted alpha-1,2-mannosidase|nr:GH92 family glycosyl hydrolase [Treponema sp.]